MANYDAETAAIYDRITQPRHHRRGGRVMDADEALLWARERMAGTWEQDGGPPLAVAAARAGDYDAVLMSEAHAYRAGGAASAERIKELEAAIQQAVERLQNYADMAVDQAAASSARVAELEAALRNALPHLETCFTHHVWRNEPMPEPGHLKNIRALLKDPDQ